MDKKGTGKPAAALVLSLLGGILQFILGIMLIGEGDSTFAGFGLEAFGWVLGPYLLMLGTMMSIGAIVMNYDPASAHICGIIILILSIISGLNSFSLIGGILAITWKPNATTRPSVPPPPP